MKPTADREGRPPAAATSTARARRAAVSLIVPFVIGLVLHAGGASRAADKVILQRRNFTARFAVSGVIEDYTGEEISIRIEPDEPPKTYPAADVMEIQTEQTAQHTRGLELLAEGRVAEAVRELETALRQEPRTWVRREILAALVRSGLRSGNYSAAGSRFLALFKSDPATRHFRLIPLAWAPEAVSRDARTAAQGWMVGQGETAQLIGASLLYNDAEFQQEARSVLKGLSSSGDSRVRVFAQMQGWRAEALSGNAGGLQTARWQERIDELPEEFRAGPSFLLGRAYAARHDYELAAATLLWLPLVDDHDFRLAARACLEAGLALTKVGQHAEAATLFREVSERFAGTPFADEAVALLKRSADDAE